MTREGGEAKRCINMNEERYNQLDCTGEAPTPEEQAEGWHYCVEWDEMLIGPGWPEMDACICKRDDGTLYARPRKAPETL